MSSITKPTSYLEKTLAHYRQIEVVKKTFSKLPIKAFKKDTTLKQTIDTNTIHNNKKLIKIEINHQTNMCAPWNSKHCLCCQQLQYIGKSETPFKIRLNKRC